MYIASMVMFVFNCLIVCSFVMKNSLLRVNRLWREIPTTQSFTMIKGAKSVSEKPTLRYWPSIWSKTPTVTDPSKLKGVQGDISQYFYSARIGYPRLVDQNKYYKCFYFEPEHLLGLFRKSKPAIRVGYQDGYLLNDVKYKGIDKSQFGKSLNPMDYAFMRVETRRMVKDVFLKNYLETEGVDGLYIFNIEVIPNKPDELVEFNDVMKNSLQITKKLKFHRMDYSKVQWDRIEQILESKNYSMSDGLKRLIEYRTKVALERGAERAKRGKTDNTSEKAANDTKYPDSDTKDI